MRLHRAVYMLGSEHGSGQSMDCAAQSMELCFEQQSMDCSLNPRIIQTEGSKAWIDLDKVWSRYTCTM